MEKKLSGELSGLSCVQNFVIKVISATAKVIKRFKRELYKIP